MKRFLLLAALSIVAAVSCSKGPQSPFVYGAIANGDFNQDLDHETAVRLEDQAGSHMAHLAALKDAIDLADDGHAGMGLVPFAKDLNADEIGGPAILDDLVAIASR